jgi:hypothetical protein
MAGVCPKRERLPSNVPIRSDPAVRILRRSPAPVRRVTPDRVLASVRVDQSRVSPSTSGCAINTGVIPVLTSHPLISTTIGWIKPTPSPRLFLRAANSALYRWVQGKRAFLVIARLEKTPTSALLAACFQRGTRGRRPTRFRTLADDGGGVNDRDGPVTPTKSVRAYPSKWSGRSLLA